MPKLRLILLSFALASAGLTFSSGARARQASTTPAVEPKALEVLQASCKVLADAKAMSFDALNTYEKAARNGQPLFYSTLNHVSMQRPDKLLVVKPGDGIPDTFIYDGKHMMAYVPSQNFIAVADAPPDIDQMIDAAWNIAGIYFPFSDVILSHPCQVFKENGMKSAFYVGQSKVIGGTTTDMVAVAGDDVQAELWIGAEDHLPRLVRVVYPHEPAHALYQTEYSNWHLPDSIDPAAFVPDDATKSANPIPFAPPGAAPLPRPGGARQP